MSLSQTYYIASSARSKLGREASRPDHNLRLLVGHANLLDSLMLELQEAEREQERWFNQTVQKAQKAEEPKHIQWVDTIVEEDEEDAESDSDDSDSEYDESDFVMTSPLRRLKSPPVTITSQEVEDDMDSDEEGYIDDMEDVPELALTRTSSQHNSPPELVDDSDSDDESPPTSPPQPMMDFSFDDEKHSLSAKEQEAFLENGFFIPERNAPMIAIQA
jgi:hypothetical protein